MAITKKLAAIADAIRAKTGKTDKLTLDEMPLEISNISGGGSEILLKPAEYPDYVRTELNRVAGEVRKVLTNDSVVSICMSDSHYPADTNTATSALHALMAIKGLTYLLPVDFIAHLGDVGFEGPSATEPDTERLQSNLLEALSYIKDSNSSSIPLFVAIGNHDNGQYITNTDNSDMLPGTFLYNNFTALSASPDTVFSGQSNGGYCYRDFPNKKVRVFLLNTSEELITGGYSNDKGTSEAQRAWLASKLLELNTKSDAAEWGFIVLCHYPADYGASKTLSNVFEAYVNGTSINLNGTTYKFNGNNTARFLVQFHGHIHNFLVDKLYGGALASNVNGTPSAQYNAYRMAIPNVQHNRENYYYNSNDASIDGTMWGIKFFEGSFDDLGASATYRKTPNSATDTSFVVNVINPGEDKIYSFHYGAGYDRVLGIGSIKYHSIIANLSNGVLINPELAAGVESGEPLNATITIPINYNIDKLVITMGGVDITTAVYADGVIDIPEVTGNVIITVEASKIPTSNLSTIAYGFEAYNTNIYNNGRGYKNDRYLSSTNTSPAVPVESASALANHVVTGIIAWDGVSDINISGAVLDESDSYCRLYFTNEARDYIYSPWVRGGTEADAPLFSNYFDITVIADNKYKLKPKSSWRVNSLITHFAISLQGSGEDLIITFGDDWGEATDKHTVKYNLVNATSSNKTAVIDRNSPYYTEITPRDGYNISDVKVTMGGVTITSAVYHDGVISIPEVTGNIIITVSTVSLLGYTNMIPLSTVAYDSDEIFNSPYGYKTNLRLNSSAEEEAPVEGYSYCCTGFIPLTGKAGDVVRIKNVAIDNGRGPYSYFMVYNVNGRLSYSLVNDSLINGGGPVNGEGVTATVENGVITIRIDVKNLGYCRLSCELIDDTSIITVNEEIPS